MLTLLTLLACQTDAPPSVLPWADCPDASCRQDRLARAWAETPDAVLAVVPTLDATEQAVLIDGLLRSHPEAVESLCSRLSPESPASQRCRRLKERPHLSMSLEVMPRAQVKRQADGPSRSHLPAPARALPEVHTDCGDGSSEAQECWFRAAETLVREGGSGVVLEALAHCKAAGNFQTPCTEHVVALALPPVPAADRATQADVDAAIAAVQDLREAAGEGPADTYERMAWARWTAQAYASANELRGDLLDVLPPLAAPHVRMALATRVVKGAPDLERWTDALQAALDLRQPLPPVPAGGTPARLGKSVELWGQESMLEQAIPADYCLGPARRAVAQDPVLDGMIAVLEAAARLEPAPAPEFFIEIVVGPHPELVRWTAARLVRHLHPDYTPPGELHLDGELVRSRLLGP